MNNPITYRRLQYILMNMEEKELDQPVKVFVKEINKYIDVNNFKFKNKKTGQQLALIAEEKEFTYNPFSMGDGDGDYFIWKEKQ